MISPDILSVRPGPVSISLRKGGAFMALNTKYIRDFFLFDDDFFRAFIDGHPECTAEILKVILSMPKIRIIRHEVQKVLNNDEQRGVRLDVYAENEETGDLINIEIQKTMDVELPRRARYYSSLIDARCTIKQNEPFSALPNSYVIFICKDDILKKDKAIYRFVRRTEDGFELGDGSSIIFVNGNYEGTDDLGLLIKDFKENDPGRISNRVLANRFSEVEDDIEQGRGDKHMVVTRIDKLIMQSREEGLAEGKAEGKAEGLAEGKAEGLAEGKAEGKAEEKINSARKLIQNGKLTNEEIAAIVDLSLEQVNKIAEGS